MDNECDKSANGEHELNFELMQLQHYVGLSCAVFGVTCRQCGASGKITIDAGEVVWEGDD